MYTTCLMGERPAGQMAGDGDRAGEQASSAGVSPSLTTTSFVHVPNRPGSTSMLLTVPPLSVPFDSTEPLIPGPGPSPLALATQSRVVPPGPATALSAAGYQPVGMYVGGPDRERDPHGVPVVASRTWTALSPARATNSIWLGAGDRAK